MELEESEQLKMRATATLPRSQNIIYRAATQSESQQWRKRTAATTHIFNRDIGSTPTTINEAIEEGSKKHTQFVHFTTDFEVAVRYAHGLRGTNGKGSIIFALDTRRIKEAGVKIIDMNDATVTFDPPLSEKAKKFAADSKEVITEGNIPIHAVVTHIEAHLVCGGLTQGKPEKAPGAHMDLASWTNAEEMIRKARSASKNAEGNEMETHITETTLTQIELIADASMSQHESLPPFIIEHLQIEKQESTQKRDKRLRRRNAHVKPHLRLFDVFFVRFSRLGPDLDKHERTSRQPD
jgi:hypothetical protein